MANRSRYEKEELNQGILIFSTLLAIIIGCLSMGLLKNGWYSIAIGVVTLLVSSFALSGWLL